MKNSLGFFGKLDPFRYKLEELITLEEFRRWSSEAHDNTLGHDALDELSERISQRTGEAFSVFKQILFKHLYAGEIAIVNSEVIPPIDSAIKADLYKIVEGAEVCNEGSYIKVQYNGVETSTNYGIYIPHSITRESDRQKRGVMNALGRERNRKVRIVTNHGKFLSTVEDGYPVLERVSEGYDFCIKLVYNTDITPVFISKQR